MKRMALVLSLAIAVLPAPAQKRNEVQELQRDVGLLADQMRQFQKDQEEKIAALTALLQKALDAANKANATADTLSQTLNQKLDSQGKALVAPMATMGAKIDHVSEEFRGLKEEVRVLNERSTRIDTKLVDISNLIRSQQQPVQAPPAPGGGGSTGGGGGTPPPGVTADGLYNSARSDQSSGKYELAIQQYEEFLKYFDGSATAPSAQFNIGECYLAMKNYEAASRAYDMVLEKYPENQKTPDARYMKGKVYLLLGQRTAAAAEFNNILDRYPGHDTEKKARAELSKLGMLTPGKKKK